jgi:GMP synthase-like glutamine amidotransferase
MSNQYKILVFQHIDVEHPGIFRRFLAEDNIAWDAVELDVGENIPALENYDALWVMGGPMDVWQEDEHPWLQEEKAAIRAAVQDYKMPYLGVCLGHQLLADALGGRVGKVDTPEVGVMPVDMTAVAKSDPVFSSLDSSIQTLQWHGTGVLQPAPGTAVLAGSPLCAVQAMRWGNHAYGIQFHVEVEADTVANWGKIPEYAAALSDTLGADALSEFESVVRKNMNNFNHSARRIYNGFIGLLENR